MMHFTDDESETSCVGNNDVMGVWSKDAYSVEPRPQILCLAGHYKGMSEFTKFCQVNESRLCSN